MKQEYINKLKLAQESLKDNDSLSTEALDEQLTVGYDLVEELAKTKDREVLWRF